MAYTNMAESRLLKTRPRFCHVSLSLSMTAFHTEAIFFFFASTYLKEEANCTEPFPSLLRKSLAGTPMGKVWKSRQTAGAMGLYPPLDGVTNLEYNLLCFLTPNKIIFSK
jgi:hypothetical protein